MNAVYIPRSDSLPGRCITFFRANPDEELTLDDIAEKFDATRSNIHTLLLAAREAGWIDRHRNKDGEYTYKAGSQISATSGVDIDAAHHGRSSARRRTPIVAEQLPDPMAVTIEDDVPIPGAHKKMDWSPLLKRLKVKQSAELPLAARHTLSQAITQAHKDRLGTFTTRHDADKKTVRVWRIA